MILQCNFHWFRIDTKHMTEPWLDQALMESHTSVLSRQQERLPTKYKITDLKHKSLFSKWIIFFLSCMQYNKYFFLVKRNWVFATNSDFFYPYSSFFATQYGISNLKYFKLWILLDQISKFEISTVYTIKLQNYRDYHISVFGSISFQYFLTNVQIKFTYSA